MKNFTLQKLGLIALLLFTCTLLLSAQEQKSSGSGIAVIKKITRKDGSTSIQKEHVDATDGLLNHLKGIDKVNGKDLEIHLMNADDANVHINNDGETLVYVRAAQTGEEASKTDLEQMRVVWHNDNGDLADQNLWGIKEGRDPCKVFIGVGTTNPDERNQGLRVNYTVDDTPAEKYGVQEGDVILALDDVNVNSQSELIRERDKHQPGDPFSLTIVRNGSEMKINARFRECSQEDIEKAKVQQEERLAQMKQRMAETQVRMAEAHARMAEMHMKGLNGENMVKIERQERPILGIYVNESANDKGVAISDVSSGKGAEAAGLQSGDVITSIDGQSVSDITALHNVLASHKPGDKVNVVYLRDGANKQTELTLSKSSDYFSYTIERDPCAVFIGVYTSDESDKQGVRVNGVIEDTPAKVSGVQPGDVILALDDAPVNTYGQLRMERDKHQPGDAFTLSIMREGRYMEIDATFKSCEQAQEAKTPVQEVVEVTTDDAPAQPEAVPQLNLDTELKVPEFNMYPNPTVGLLNVQFQAEAVPTSVRIMDAAGKTVYQEQLNNFDGTYNKQLNLSGNTPGTYILTVQQGKKMISKKIALMPRV